MLKSNWTACVAMLLVGLVAAGPVHAADAPLTTLIDLSADEMLAQEVAAEVLRSLKRDKQVRFKDLDDGLNLGGEEMLVSAVRSADGLLKSGAAKLKKKEFEEDTVADWKFAAMVVDRICLFIFTLFTIIATVAVLFSAPHIIVQ